MFKKKRCAERAAAGARRVERGFAVVADGVRFRPGLQEHAEDVAVAVEGGEVHGRHVPAAHAVQSEPLGGRADGVVLVREAASLLPHADEVRQSLREVG